MIAAGRSLGREVIVLKCGSAEDFEAAFAALVERSAGALVLSAFPTAFNNRAKILALAARHKIPTIYPQSEYAYEGGLMSYSPVTNLRRIAVDYVAPILKGAKPTDLAAQVPACHQPQDRQGTRSDRAADAASDRRRDYRVKPKQPYADDTQGRAACLKSMTKRTKQLVNTFALFPR
jgi:hypothetical protein